jgi:hypothetical protein
LSCCSCIIELRIHLQGLCCGYFTASPIVSVSAACTVMPSSLFRVRGGGVNRGRIAELLVRPPFVAHTPIVKEQHGHEHRIMHQRETECTVLSIRMETRAAQTMELVRCREQPPRRRSALCVNTPQHASSGSGGSILRKDVYSGVVQSNSSLLV